MEQPAARSRRVSIVTALAVRGAAARAAPRSPGAPRAPPGRAAHRAAAASSWTAGSALSRGLVVPLTHSPSSFFQIGAWALISSMISRAPANASPRCGADAATATEGSDSGTSPIRCSAAAAHSPWRSIAACDDLGDLRARPSRRRPRSRAAATSRVTPRKVTTAPARGSRTRSISGSTVSGSSVTRAWTRPPTPRRPAGSAPARRRGAAARCSIGVLLVDRHHHRQAAGQTAGAGRARRATRAPSGSSSSSSSAPARSRSPANKRTRTCIAAQG